MNTSPTDHTFNSFNRITHSSLIQLLSSSNVNIVNCMFSKSVQEGFCILFSFQVHREFSILFACSPPKACVCCFQFCLSHHPASCASRWISVIHSTFQCFANDVAKIFRRLVHQCLVHCCHRVEVDHLPHTEVRTSQVHSRVRYQKPNQTASMKLWFPT